MREGAKNEGKNWGYKHVGREAPRDPGVVAHDNLTGLLGLKITGGGGWSHLYVNIKCPFPPMRAFMTPQGRG